MKWIATPALVLALALAASQLAGCDEKARPPAPAAGAQPAPAPSGGAPVAESAPAAPPPSMDRGQHVERHPAGGAPAAPAPAGPEVTSAETIRLLTEVADKGCACKDRACVEAVYAALQVENKRLGDRPRAKPTQAEIDVMQAQALRLSSCIKQLP
ncbi:MAG TPA: hypothetical protein VNO30_42985 [Kofleriaceae bacterium]|nr:hypothetical protein [Kofleriaceae bacterium]